MSRNSGAMGWGDEEEEEGYLPDKHETEIDARGIKTVTEYKFDEAGNKIKVTKKVRVINTITRRTKASEERRKRIQKFGNALGVEDESNVTITDFNEVKMMNPKASEAEDETAGANVSAAFANFQKKQQWRSLQRKYDMEDGNEGDPANKPPEGEEGADSKDKPSGGMFGGAGGSKYVPPGARAGAVPAAGAAGGRSLSAMSFDDRDYTTIRVTNISEDTKEVDLQDLFETFGRIFRIYLAKDRETGESRGFAFVSFSRREDAERAMEALQGYGYDHLILKLEWARPSTRDNANAGAEATQFRSGYGKALAQDTKEKVSFASNLTK